VIRGLERLTVGGLVPDLTFVLDIDPRIGLARAAARRATAEADRFEEEKLEFHQRLREAYAEIAGDNPERCVLIDASGTPERIAETIWKVVERRLEPSTAPALFEDAS
jgi:dTMP kinase